MAYKNAFGGEVDDKQYSDYLQKAYDASMAGYKPEDTSGQNNLNNVDSGNVNNTGDNSGNTDPNKTVSDIYGADYIPKENADLNSAYDTYGNIIKEDLKPVDEEAIRERTMKQFQAEIDALDRVYADKRAEERIAGEGRLGQSAAIQGRRGLLGSDFGTAQTATVSKYNKGILDSIESELNLKKAAILEKVRTSVADEVAGKTAARRQGAKDYIDYLAKSEERKRKQLTDAVVNVINAKVEADDDLLKEIATQLGVSLQQIKAEYNKQKQAAVKDVKTMVVAPGSSIYDETGKLIGTAPDKPTDNKPITQEVGNALLQYDPKSNTWKNIYTSQDKSTQKIVNIGGTDYVQNSDGTYSLPEIPQVAKNITPEQAQSAEKMVTDINNILESKGFKGAVGAGSLLGLNPNWWRNMSGTDRADTATAINALISSETLKNMGLIKGVLSDSDMKILKEASTGGLSTNISEEEFKKRINAIKNSAYSIANAPKLAVNQVVENGDGTYSYKNNDGTVHTGELGDNYVDNTVKSGGKTFEDFKREFPQATDEEIRALMAEETANQPFKSVGSDTKQATGYLSTLGPITAENGSPLWKWGLDVSVQKGQPLTTPVSGTVVVASDKGDGFGKRVGIRTSNGNIVYLSHLDGVNVTLGQTVNSGDIIGLGGNTGNVLKMDGTSPTPAELAQGRGTHLDITVQKPDGSYYTPQEIKSRLS
jgi:murein DD-endopeptidase MepM/ murein hydrolase activator NlpD